MENKNIIQEAQKIMFNKLKEMSELNKSDFFPNVAAYDRCCSAMCEVCKTLVELQGHIDEVSKHMSKYRKKPVIIEAYQTDKEMIIHTLEGDHKANVGDYIITGVHGEQYPCKPDIFEETYEKVE